MSVPDRISTNSHRRARVTHSDREKTNGDMPRDEMQERLFERIASSPRVQPDDEDSRGDHADFCDDGYDDCDLGTVLPAASLEGRRVCCREVLDKDGTAAHAGFLDRPGPLKNVGVVGADFGRAVGGG